VDKYENFASPRGQGIFKKDSSTLQHFSTLWLLSLEKLIRSS